MKFNSGLKTFLAEYEQYEIRALKPTYDEILKLLNSWENPEYWEKYAVSKGVATPSPIRLTFARIKHPEKVVDKIIRKPNLFPEGLSSQSILRMEDAIGIRIIVYFVSQLPLIDKELRSSGLFEVSEKSPPEAYLSPDLLTRFGLTHIKQKNKESGYASIHYTVRLKNSSLTVQERPYFEIQVRTMAQELWSELEHILAYKPENRPHFSAKRRLQILSKEMSAIDEQFNLLYEELIHNQETATYQDSDLLNFENLPKVLMEVGVKCALRDLNPILKLLTSRGVDTVKDLLLLATPRRLETIRNTYISSLGHPPDVLEISAALAALKGADTKKTETERIKSQIDYHQSDIFSKKHRTPG
ncbi:hypothetical protein KJ966_22410 [bacterium]|nr:hypothetical protein [bacterium]